MSAEWESPGKPVPWIAISHDIVGPLLPFVCFFSEGAQMSDIETPITLAEGNDLWFYETEEEAVTDLEPVDVALGSYEAFDRHGQRLGLGVIKDDRGRDRVHLQRIEVPTDKEVLRLRILAFAAAVNPSITPPQIGDLEAVVQWACKNFGS